MDSPILDPEDVLYAWLKTSIENSSPLYQRHFGTPYTPLNFRASYCQPFNFGSYNFGPPQIKKLLLDPINFLPTSYHNQRRTKI